MSPFDALCTGTVADEMDASGVVTGILKKKGRTPLLLVFAVFVAGGFLWFLFPRHDFPSYEMIDLGTFGWDHARATDVSNKGHIAGWGIVVWGEIAEDDIYAFVWDMEKGLRDLGTLGGKNSFAHGCNDEGMVVGEAETSDGSRHAFLWTPEAGMKDLGTLGGKKSVAFAINNRGEVVGEAETLSGERRPFRWDSAKGMTDLSMPNSVQGTARAINDAGRIVGEILMPNSRHHAFYWDKDTGMVDLVGTEGPSSYATDINEAGQVVGNVFNREFDNYTGFVWKKKTGLQGLHESYAESYAERINDAEEIIGRVRTYGGLFFSSRQFHYLQRPSGPLVDLDQYSPYDPDCIKATAINNQGWIVGQRETTSGGRRVYSAVLLKPKQE